MGASSPRSSRPARWRSTRRGVDVADDDLTEALAALLDVGGAARSLVSDEAAAVAAAVCRDSPGARTSWADAFGTATGTFDEMAAIGLAYATGPTPVLAGRLARDQDLGEQARAYAR